MRLRQIVEAHLVHGVLEDLMRRHGLGFERRLIALDHRGRRKRVDRRRGGMHAHVRVSSASRTAAKAFATPAGFLPPPCAKFGRPPPRPSTFSAITLSRSPALRPRATRSSLTLTINATSPSLTPARATTPLCKRPRMAFII